MNNINLNIKFLSSTLLVLNSSRYNKQYQKLVYTISFVCLGTGTEFIKISQAGEAGTVRKKLGSTNLSLKLKLLSHNPLNRISYFVKRSHSLVFKIITNTIPEKFRFLTKTGGYV